MAAAWANYKTDEFMELDGEIQSMIVAAYETHNQIDAVLAKEETTQAIARAKRKK